MRETFVSDEPQKAPKGYRALPAKVVVSDGEGLWETWQGSGLPTSAPCLACGNTENNLQIYGNVGTSYPNGNQWNDSEIVCGRCGRYTLVNEFAEG